MNKLMNNQPQLRAHCIDYLTKVLSYYEILLKNFNELKARIEILLASEEIYETFKVGLEVRQKHDLKNLEIDLLSKFSNYKNLLKRIKDQSVKVDLEMIRTIYDAISWLESFEKTYHESYTYCNEAVYKSKDFSFRHLKADFINPI